MNTKKQNLYLVTCDGAQSYYVNSNGEFVKVKK
jgi:hypothetical protein